MKRTGLKGFKDYGEWQKVVTPTCWTKDGTNCVTSVFFAKIVKANTVSLSDRLPLVAKLGAQVSRMSLLILTYCPITQTQMRSRPSRPRLIPLLVAARRQPLAVCSPAPNVLARRARGRGIPEWRLVPHDVHTALPNP